MGRGKIERRGSKPRQTKPVILIVTEGEKSEPKYFEHFRTRQNNVDVRVVPNSKNGGKTDYGSLIRKAVKICGDDDLSPRRGDSVWIVADGDVNYQAADAIGKKNAALSEARKKAEKPDILMNYGKVLQYVQNHPCYKQSALQEWSKASVADAWIIATAVACGYTIVTFEKAVGNLSERNPSKNAKIPNVASEFGVSVVTLYDMMRTLGFHL